MSEDHLIPSGQQWQHSVVIPCLLYRAKRLCYKSFPRYFIKRIEQEERKLISGEPSMNIADKYILLARSYLAMAILIWVITKNIPRRAVFRLKYISKYNFCENKSYFIIKSYTEIDISKKHGIEYHKSNFSGHYRIDGFLITFSMTSNSVTDDDKLMMTPTFMHEYIHFLHNVSTIAGFRSLMTSLMLWLIFRKTVERDGFSRGSGNLSATELEAVRQHLQQSRLLLGSGWMDGMENVRSVDINTWNIKDITRNLGGKDIPGTIIAM